MALIDRSPRVRPWLRRLAIWAFAVLVPIALWTLWDYLEARRLARIVAEIRAKGEPIDTLDRRFDPSNPPGNAARYYMAATALVDTRGFSGRNGLLSRLERAGTDRRSLLPDIRRILDSNAEAEKLLARATDLEFDGERPGFEYTYRQSGHVTLSRLADLRVMERAFNGDGDAAVVALLRQVGLTRPLGWNSSGSRTGSMSWVGSYVARSAASNVPDVLEARPSDEAIEELAKGLKTIDLDSTIEQSVIAQRAVLLQTYWNDTSHWYANPPRDFFVSSPAFFLLRPMVIHRVNAQARLLSSLIESSRRPWPERVTFAASREDRATARDRSPMLMYLMDILDPDAVRSEYQNYANLAARTLAIIRCARAAVAIEQFRRTHAGELPRSLGEFVPTFLPMVPIDPYSGNELHYRLEDRSYAVYSVGADGRDDGGNSVTGQTSRRWNAFSRGNDPADVGFRISRDSAPASGHSTAGR